MSGAGRHDTYRSDTALAARFTTACGSNPYEKALIRATNARSPNASNSVRFPATTSSTRTRSASDRHAVSRTSNVARHSLITPALKARNVHGISVVSTFANPNNLLPRCGDSRRANPICAPTPRPSCCPATPARACARDVEASNAAAAHACAAATAHFSSSNNRISSINRTRSAASKASKAFKAPAVSKASDPLRVSGDLYRRALSAIRPRSAGPCGTPVVSTTGTPSSIARKE
ncbi:hypothetical protein ABIB35_000918 [Arthrobacter sp. UYP6]